MDKTQKPEEQEIDEANEARANGMTLEEARENKSQAEQASAEL